MTVAVVSAPPTPEEERKIVQDALVYLRRTIEKMKALQATERVLSHVERAMLNRLPVPYDLKPLVGAISVLSNAVQKGDPEKVRQASAGVSYALDASIDALAERDAGVMPYNLRRFCDQPENLVGPTSYAAMTGFYRGLPHTEAVRGKYDFTVTRFFASPFPGKTANYRQLKSTRKQVTVRLIEMCHGWGELISKTPEDTAKIVEICRQFDKFIVEIQKIQKLEDVITSNYFNRIRDFKTGIGEYLFQPEVTATSVDANISINNRFLELLELDSQAPDLLSDEVQLVMDVFSATYADNTEDIRKIISDELPQEAKSEAVEQADQRLIEKLHLVEAVKEESVAPAPDPFFAEKEPQTPSPFVGIKAEREEERKARKPVSVDNVFELPGKKPKEEEKEEPIVDDGPWEEFPGAYLVKPENEVLISQVGRGSKEVAKLNLSNFLGPLPTRRTDILVRQEKLRRRALELIVIADEAIQHELKGSQHLSPQTEAMVEELFVEMEDVSNGLRDLVHETRQPELEHICEILLYVSNQLMGGRLRLQAAQVRHHTRETEVINEAEPEHEDIVEQVEEIIAETAPVVAAKVARFSRLKVNKWLLAGAVMAIIASLGLRVMLGSSDSRQKNAPDVVFIAPAQAPHSELIRDARKRKELMVITVSDQWNKVTRDERRKMIRDFLDFAKSMQAETVLLLDRKGMNVGVASRDEITVE